ncbi:MULTISPECIES: hypothetical protein [Gammaproteobacteria]|jgi:hypothetical protein|uniref:Uncharacterized protein n=1 Tax=Vreelandella halophila TaxID=86177 RepID=A0A9X4YBU2_9GAMM|nr:MULTISPECIES: hypothetical protein [Gammaproteobacteria]MYL26355.1 hypothetical protein [Halomonas utahensis]MYL73692.1 hypothetical protein [Halomonas sp. 22501_18_FS]
MLSPPAGTLTGKLNGNREVVMREYEEELLELGLQDDDAEDAECDDGIDL